MNIDKMRHELEKFNFHIDDTGFLHTFNKDGDIVPISNFIYWFTEFVEIDDGQELIKIAVVEGLLNGKERLGKVSIQFDKMQGPNWAIQAWGIKCRVYPGMNKHSQLFFVAQLLSEDAVTKSIFAHLGWHKVEDKWSYLHCAGSIGGKNVQVQLDKSLERYRFPCGTINAKKTFEALVAIERLANPNTMIPLTALVFLSPLVAMFKSVELEPNFLVLLHGQTGTRKTSLALVLMKFFGDFGNTAPPASFKDTSNSLELKAFQTKDSLLLIDDFHPQSSSAESKLMQQNFQRLLRGYGDRIGRGRMSSDLKQRKDYPPRGMALITGEDQPRGHSSVARYIGIELEKNEINLELLSKYQNGRNNLCEAMVLYISWLQPNFKEVSERLKNSFLKIRSERHKQSFHGRTADAVVFLQVAYEIFVEFLFEHQVVKEERANQMLDEAIEVFKMMISNQNRMTSLQNPVETFVTIFGELLARGKVTLTPKNQRLGIRSGDKTSAIGWKSKDFYYLLPEATYNALSTHLSQRGEVVPVSQTTLWKMLASNGLLAIEIEGERIRNTVKVALIDATGTKNRTRVLKIRREVFENFHEKKEA